MKKYILLLILILFFNKLFCQNQLSVMIEKQGIYFNNIKIDKTDLKKTFEILGESDKIHKLKNNIFTYDSVGLLVYEKNEIVQEFVFNFSEKAEFEFSTKTCFSDKNTLSINGHKISKNNNFIELSKKFNLIATDDYSISFKITNDLFSVYFNFDNDKIQEVTFSFNE